MASILTPSLRTRVLSPARLFVDADAHRAYRLVIWMFAALLLFQVPEIIMTGGAQRVVAEETAGQPPTDESNPAWSALMGSFICFLAALMLVSSYLDRRATDRRYETLLRSVWLSYLAYCGIQIARGLVAGSIDSTIIKLSLPIVILTMCYMARHEPYERVYAAYRTFIWGYSIAALVLLAVAPLFVIMERYKGVLPGVSWRMHGFHHANQIGLLIAVYWLMKPPAGARLERQWISRVCDLATVLVLLLTQSKTTFLILGVGLVANFLLPLCRRSAVVATACVAGIVIGSCTLFLVSDEIDTVVTENTDLAPGSIDSLSSRTEIWDAALSDWQESPWFGYGANMWGQLAWFRNGARLAPHTHNQLLQTLWEVGVVGAVALAVHLGLLIWAAWRTDSGIGGGLFAATSMYIVTGVSGVPLPTGRCTSLLFLIYAFLFLAVCTSLAGCPESDAMASTHMIGRLAGRRRRAPVLAPVAAGANAIACGTTMSGLGSNNTPRPGTLAMRRLGREGGLP